MNVVKLDKLIWALIYGGLLGLSWSVFIAPESAGAIWTIRVVSAAAVVAGVVLIVVRSKMKDPAK